MSKTKVITGKVRLSYPHLFTPAAAEGSDIEKYSASLIIDKGDTKTLNAINQAIEAAKEEGKANKWGGKIPANLKLPLRDGDTDREDDEAYQDKMFVNASSKRKPGIVDQRKQKIEDETVIYAGCYVRAALNFYPFNANGNKGVAVGLQNIQKWADGEALAGGSSAEEDFDEIEIEETDLDDLI